VYCHRDQLRWLLPRSVRWALAVALLGIGYLLSAGPVDWLHANRRMSKPTYAWLSSWVYFPINRWLDSPAARNWTVTQRYAAYRSFWSPEAPPGAPAEVERRTADANEQIADPEADRDEGEERSVGYRGSELAE